MKRDHHSKVSELEEKIKNFKVPNNYVKKLIAAETYKWWKWWYALYVVLDNFWCEYEIWTKTIRWLLWFDEEKY